MLGNLKWIAATFAAAVLAIICAGGWLREYWISDSRRADAVAVRDVEWSNKLDAATARNEALAASIDLRALQAADAVRSHLVEVKMPVDERQRALERAIAALGADDPVVFPRALARELHR